MRSTILFQLVVSAGAALIDTSSAPLPIGELGWEGVVVPGEPAVVVWGVDLDVGSSRCP
jgi:hypothetical protein